MKRVLPWVALALISAGQGHAQSAGSNVFIDVAYQASISATHICYTTDDGRGELWCNEPGPTILPGGAISASAFVGDGSGLTNLLVNGDRIVSGTHAVTVNEGSGYVSLSTGGTSWGYLGSANSYLPKLSAAAVSGTLVSASYVQISSATSVLACATPLAGTLRYTSGTMQVCDGTEWTNVGVGVPSGTIAAFATASCPPGWNEYTPARGRFLRGIDTLAAGIDPAGTRAAGSAQADALQTHSHSVAFGTPHSDGTYLDRFARAVSSASSLSQNVFGNQLVIGANTAAETRPKNVAVTFCQYSGYGGGEGGGGAGGAPDNLGDHTATQTLQMGSHKIHFSDTEGGDKVTWYSNTYGTGIESGTLTSWAGFNHRWRIGGTSVSTGTEQMLLNTAGLTVTGNISGTSGFFPSATISSLSAGAIAATRVSSTNISNSLLWTDQICDAAGANCTSPQDVSAVVNGQVSLTGFTVTKSSPQSFSAGGQVVTWGNVVTNARGGFDTMNNRFVAPVAGLYYFHASLAANADTGSVDFRLYRNGAVTVLRSYGGQGGTHNYRPAQLGGVLSLNGGDTIDIRSSTSGISLFGDSTAPITTFSGFLLNGGAAGSGNGATVIAELTDVDTTGAVPGKVLRYDGSSWVVSDSGAGILAGLADVSASSPISNSLLRYTNGKWTATELNTGLGSTSIVPGWPDAITCNSSSASQNNRTYIRNTIFNAGGAQYSFPTDSAAQRIMISFNGSGAFSGHSSAGGEDCVTNAWSIAQLYAMGRAFNYLGGTGSGADNLGDHTATQDLNMAGHDILAAGLVSGTTGFFPTATISSLSAGAIAANSVSSAVVRATNISASYVQIPSATTVLACGSSLTGTMRYTSGTMQVCNGADWTNIGLGVPTGTIAAFALSSCPSGWTEYTPARGRFLRGIDNGAGNDPGGTRAPGNVQADLLAAHTHNILRGTPGSGGSDGVASNVNNLGSNPYAQSTGGAETRPKNVAVTFCQYSGFGDVGGGIVPFSETDNLSDIVQYSNGSTSGNVTLVDITGSGYLLSGAVSGYYPTWGGANYRINITIDGTQNLFPNTTAFSVSADEGDNAAAITLPPIRFTSSLKIEYSVAGSRRAFGWASVKID